MSRTTRGFGTSGPLDLWAFLPRCKTMPGMRRALIEIEIEVEMVIEMVKVMEMEMEMEMVKVGRGT